MEQTSPNVSVKKGSKKVVVFLVLGAVILAGLAGIFYYLDYRAGKQIDGPPKLFSKGDYKVETRADGQYIVVDKVGLTAKVPATWRVEFEGQDVPDGNSQYWVNLLSPDAEIVDILIRGCSISLISGSSKENFDSTNDKIAVLKENPENSSNIREGYNFSLVDIGTYKSLSWSSSDKPVVGQVFGVDIPVSQSKVIGMESRILPDQRSTCFPVWENFVKDIAVK